MLGNYLTDDDLLTIKQDKFLKAISDDKNNIILDALNFAISKVKIYLNSKYDLTAHYNGDQSIPYLKQLTINILLYEMYKRVSPTNISTSIKLSYDEAMKDIQNIAKGIISIPELDKPADTIRVQSWFISKENFYN